MKIFEILRLKRKIRICKYQIKELEERRSRSQASLTKAIIEKTTPDDNDVEFFNKYSDQIEMVRQKMKRYEKKLEDVR